MKQLAWAALAAMTLAACGGPVDKTGRVPGILALTGDVSAGQTVFANTCAGCHGPEGKGGSAKAIASAIPGHTPETLATIALNGTGFIMGPAGKDLSDQQVADLVAWLKATLR